MKVLFKRFHKDAVIPYRTHEIDGGWDVVVTEIEETNPWEVVCKLGFGVAVPEGYKLTIVPRSSLTKSYWMLQNTPALIDASYRGEIILKFKVIIGYQDFPYKPGDRIAQCYLEEVLPMEFIEVDELGETDRGKGGFGSTNK